METPLQHYGTQQADGELRFQTPKRYEKRNLIKSLQCKKGLNIVTVTSRRKLRPSVFLQTIFALFDQYEIRFELVTISDISVSVVLEALETIRAVEPELEQIGRLSIESDKAFVSVITDEMGCGKAFAAQVFSAIRTVNVSLVSQTEKGSRLNFVVGEKELDAVAWALFERFFEKSQSVMASGN
jgi:aspartate kinase